MIRRFMTVTELSEELGLTKDIARKRVTEMRQFVPERYSKADFFGEGKGQAVRFAAFQDFAEFKRLHSLGVATPKYTPRIVEQNLGLIDMPQEVDYDLVASEVAKRIMSALKEV